MADSSWWKRLSVFERSLTVIVFLVTLLSIALAIAIGVIVPNRIRCETGTVELPNGNFSKGITPAKRYCLTPTCVDAASTILKNMNDSMNPCDDFYNFACGNFIEETTVPDDKVGVFAYSPTADHIQAQLKTIIEKPIMPGEPKFSKLVKKLYQSCMDKKTIKERSMKEFLAMLKELGGWPVLEGGKWKEADFHWIKSIYKFRDLGLSTDYLLQFRILTDWMNNTRRIIHLDQPSFGISRGNLAARNETKTLKAYREYMIDIAVLLGAPRKVAVKELAKALEFEKILAKVSLSTKARRTVPRLHNPETLKDLSNEYPNIPWKEFFNRLLAPKISVDDNETINVRVPGYLSKFAKFIEAMPRRIVANYVIWRVIADSISYLTEDLRARQLEFESEVAGTVTRKQRWDECIDIVSEKLPLSVGSLYVRGHFDQNAKKSAFEMFRYIRDEMNIALQRVKWMDAETRKNALRKCSAIVAHIGYPDELLDNNKLDELYQELELSGDSYFKSILNITKYSMEVSIGDLRKPVERSDWRNHGASADFNALYRPLENSIDIRASVLQGVYFNSKYPKYMNFGGMGFVIGHEITHGFDSLGRYFDKLGNVANWWTPPSEVKFEHEVECIINQYSNYVSPELGIHLNGEVTLDENIADNGGIKLAYAAYNKWASTNKKEQSLPGLHYTPIQMFWISAANIWCAKYRPTYLEHMMTRASHSPSEYRVLGPFSNRADFAKDFKCKVGTKMNPKKKCGIW